MKKMIICIVFLSMMGGKCFSQTTVWDAVKNVYKNSDKEVLNALDKGYGLGAQGRWAEAFPYLKYGADKGDISIAQYEVALCYQYGEGVSVDFAEAFKYFYKAATNTKTKPWGQALYSLGECYRDGKGTSKNLEEAFKWFSKGADGGAGAITTDEEVAKCMLEVGHAYILGEGVKQDINQAVYWLAKAYENGCISASGTLAIIYLNGNGLPKDEVKGVEWLKKAMELNNPMLQYNMGLVYKYGAGNEPINKSKALEWFKKAAAQGYTEALDQIRMLEK